MSDDHRAQLQRLRTRQKQADNLVQLQVRGEAILQRLRKLSLPGLSAGEKLRDLTDAYAVAICHAAHALIELGWEGSLVADEDDLRNEAIGIYHLALAPSTRTPQPGVWPPSPARPGDVDEIVERLQAYNTPDLADVGANVDLWLRKRLPREILNRLLDDEGLPSSETNGAITKVEPESEMEAEPGEKPLTPTAGPPAAATPNPEKSAEPQQPPLVVAATAHLEDEHLGGGGALHPRRRNRRAPPAHYIMAFRFRMTFSGKQEDMAAMLQKEFFKNNNQFKNNRSPIVTQASVSKMLKRVKEWMEAGNVLPPLPDPSREHPTTIAPDVIDLGRRENDRGRSQRQRQRSKTDDD